MLPQTDLGYQGSWGDSQGSIKALDVLIHLLISSLVHSFIQHQLPCTAVSFHGVIEAWKPDVLFYAALSAVVGCLKWMLPYSRTVLRL